MLLENMFFFVTFFVINVYVFQYIKHKSLTLLLFIFKISGRSVDCSALFSAPTLVKLLHTSDLFTRLDDAIINLLQCLVLTV